MKKIVNSDDEIWLVLSPGLTNDTYAMRVIYCRSIVPLTRDACSEDLTRQPHKAKIYSAHKKCVTCYSFLFEQLIQEQKHLELPLVGW